MWKLVLASVFALGATVPIDGEEQLGIQLLEQDDLQKTTDDLQRTTHLDIMKAITDISNKLNKHEAKMLSIETLIQTLASKIDRDNCKGELFTTEREEVTDLPSVQLTFSSNTQDARYVYKKFPEFTADDKMVKIVYEGTNSPTCEIIRYKRDADIYTDIFNTASGACTSPTIQATTTNQESTTTAEEPTTTTPEPTTKTEPTTTSPEPTTKTPEPTTKTEPTTTTPEPTTKTPEPTTKTEPTTTTPEPTTKTPEPTTTTPEPNTANPFRTFRMQTCQEGWIAHGYQCIWISDDLVTFDQAEQNCKNLGAHVAKIENRQKWAFIKQYLSTASTWIGLTDRQEEGVFRWTKDNSELTFAKWDDGEPNNDGGKEHCTELRNSVFHYFNDAVCSNKNHFLCEKPSTFNDVRCQEEDADFFEGLCYHVSNEKGSWEEGISYCSQKGGTYAKVVTKEQWAFIRDRTSNDTWISLNDLGKEGHFLWQSDGSQAFTRWSEGNPDNYGNGEDCVHFQHHKEDQWNDNDCSHNFKYLCETRQVDSKCPENFLEFQNSCYFISDAKATWSAAKDACEDMGAYLAKMSTLEENDFIRERFVDHTWFGLSDLTKEGHFVWTKDDEPLFDHDLWGEGEPNSSGNEDSVHLMASKGYYLNDLNGHHEHHFACTMQPTAV